MKKLTLLAVIILGCISLLASSCGETDCRVDRDNTLAGSITMFRNNIVAEASYDGVPLDNDRFFGGFLDIYKLSNTEVSLLCYTSWGDEDLGFKIPYIPVFGVPYRAIFNYNSNNAEVRYNMVTYYPTTTTISGWITEENLAPTRCSPAISMHTFEIKLDFTFEDGKILNVIVTPKKRQ